MESKTLLNTLSPQLQALVEASLGAKLPSSAASKPEYDPPKPQPTNTNTKTQSDISNRIVLDASHHAAKLNPSELFALKHPESPGFVIKEAFLGRQNALAVRDALTELAASGTFHEAKVGAGQNLRSDRAVETLVYGLKKVSPELDLRNVVSTQFAIFPGDGARFVKHVDTYSNAHSDERGGMSKDGLVRLVTCVYYLNDQWEPEHDDDDDTRAYLESKYSTSKGEVFYLQIDSHMRFRPGWDCFLINELEKPLPSLFWAAGFAFSSSKVIEEVPYDETLRFLFFGEESSMAARLWTSGWDFFTPSETVVYHLWTRTFRPVFQELESDETKRYRSASAHYVKQLLQIDQTPVHQEDTPTVGKYALGTERSFESYQNHIGVNFSSRDIEWSAEWGDLDPIQFDLKANAGKILTPAVVQHLLG
ncbi:hypothetical protein JG688_00012878 [Phytophthora aleatoria]|uniref:Uncharacterized protein n=1 Tax=Phytophthora aleatoria TaxID=2496075 RepID=A0A8J5ME75_9STRA|nr:hypothetical protein JG688_00012878 [Phytophthora aleatoria]